MNIFWRSHFLLFQTFERKKKSALVEALEKIKGGKGFVNDD